MIDLLSANNYYLEALSLLDDELLKYQGDEQLNWWAQAVVGLFGDLVDVEAIGQIDNNANYFSQMMEGYSDSENLFSILYWKCGDYQAMAHLWQGQFLIINSQSNCTTAQFLPTNAKIMGSYLECKLFKCPPIPGQQDLCIMECMNDNGDGGDGGGGGVNSYNCQNMTCADQTNTMEECFACCSSCFNDCLQKGKSRAICQSEKDACDGLCLPAGGNIPRIPCYYCNITPPM
ncbi:MAG: hypothetical protein N2445_02080 [Acidobacteria bacterium]|nr:hypothetical protein [Acidobacteriota bacterium]